MGGIPDAKDVIYCTRVEDGVLISSSLERDAEMEVIPCRVQSRLEVDLTEVDRIAKSIAIFHQLGGQYELPGMTRVGGTCTEMQDDARELCVTRASCLM